MRYGNELSDAADIPSGVPQGSVLSPLFVAIFVNDLLCKIFSNSIICYADDIKIWGPPSDSIGSDIGLLSEWMESNYMSVNTDKCEVIHFGRNNHHRSYFYRNTPIRVVQEFRDLGVLVDSKLTFRSHSLSVYIKCLRLIHIIFKVFSSRSADLYIKAFNVNVFPVVGYCSYLYFNRSLINSNQVEKIQKTFTKRLFYRVYRNEPCPSYGDRLKLFSIPIGGPWPKILGGPTKNGHLKFFWKN